MSSMIRAHRGAVMLFAVAALAAGGARSQDTYGTLSSAHFEVKFQRPIPQEDARKVMDFLQSEYKSLSADLGVELKSRIEVRIYESVGKYLSETGLKRPWRAAYYQRGMLHLQPVSALVTRKIFEKAISYELALAFLDEAAQKGCPRWLVEAFAVYYCGETAGMTAPVGARMTSFSDLNQDVQEYPNPPQRDDVHYILGSTMTFLVQKYGERKAFRVYKEFDGVTTVDKVFKKVFDEDYASIEKAWAQYIASRTASFK
ncbi:MAG: hypothetical protein AB1428_00805 [Bacteroidota bacterium]